jgi:hypothetical protein
MNSGSAVRWQHCAGDTLRFGYTINWFIERRSVIVCEVLLASVSVSLWKWLLS